MADALATVVVVAAAYLGFSALALGKPRHTRAVLGELLQPAPVQRLRVAGAALLAASFVVSVYVKGPSFGGLFGVLALSAAALALTFTLAFRPHWLRPIAQLFGLGRGSAQ